MSRHRGRLLICWTCKDDLIWNVDHSEEDDQGNDVLVSYFTCPTCNAEVVFYHGEPEDSDLLRP